MEKSEKRQIGYYMRFLHRYIGFFVIGLTAIYAISGIILIYRDTGFLKQERNIEKQIAPNLKPQELGMILHIKNFEALKMEGNTVYFKNGTYDKGTGLVKYSEKALPEFLEKLNGLHKSSSKSSTVLFSTLYGTLLLFLAISSFWMFKPKTAVFKKGIITAGAGFIFAAALLLI